MIGDERYIHCAVSKCVAYVKDHFMDHVGRSFSRMRVYTERVDRVPTARRPRTGQELTAKRREIITRHAVEGRDLLIFRKEERRVYSPIVISSA